MYRDRFTPVMVLAFVLLAGALSDLGCRHGADSELTTSADEAEPAQSVADPQIFAPLRRPLPDGTRLPFLLNDRGVVELRCFKVLEEQPVMPISTSELKRPLEASREALQQVLRGWFGQQIPLADLRGVSVESWTFVPQEVVTWEIDDMSLRFVDSAECIDSSTGWMEPGTQVVTGLFGSKSFRVSARTPLPRKSAEALRKAVNDGGLTFDTEDLIDYELVTEADGQPRKGEKGEKLYRSPDVGIVSESEITPPERQRLKTWTISASEPVIFGYRELAKAAWLREDRRDDCNINLVWGDPTFRESDCLGLTGVGFTATKQGSQIEVRLKVADAPPLTPSGPAKSVKSGKLGKAGRRVSKATKAKEGVKAVVLSLETVERVQVDDRRLLWISPVAIEEGVLIRVNSLVLDPTGR